MSRIAKKYIPQQYANSASEENLSSYIYGKVQPQALPLEEAVLGALMLDRDGLSIVMDILHEDVFYLNAHKYIYSAIMGLYESSYPVDLLTVTEYLRQKGQLKTIGGTYYLVELTNRVASAANIEFHSRIIYQYYLKRKMIKCASLIIDDSHNEASDCFDIYSHFMLEMEEIMLSLSSGKTQDEKVLSLAYLKEIRERRKGNAFGFLLGLSNLDKVFKGLRDALVCIAARPGMGKTVMLMQIVKNASERGEIVPVFSLEMSNTKLFERLVCNVGSIDNYDLKRVAELPDDEYQHLLDTINIISQKYPLSCNDEGGISINSLRAEAIRLKKMHGKKMTALCIDYLQLITSINDALIREQVVASIMKILVKLKKELNIPIIILAQLSRGVETRGGSKIPQLSDLRESGSVEQDCDVVMFLHRDEYYGVMEDQFGESTKGVIKAIIAKNRDGQQETVKMNYIAKYSRIMDLDDFPLLPSSINLVKKDIPF